MHPLKSPSVSDRLAVRTRPAGRKPAMYQRWDDLLFLHWSYAPMAIQGTLPRGLTVDTFEGKAYIGIVPFFMRDVRPSFCPRLPGFSDFLELNVRTTKCAACRRGTCDGAHVSPAAFTRGSAHSASSAKHRIAPGVVGKPLRSHEHGPGCSTTCARM